MGVMNTLTLLLLLSGLAAWLAGRQPSAATALAAATVILLTLTKLLGLHLVLGQRLASGLDLHATAGLADRQLGKLLAEALIGGIIVMTAAAATASAHDRLSRHAARLAAGLVTGFALAAGIDLLAADGPGAPADVAALALAEDGIEALAVLAVLVGWVTLCVAPRRLIGRQRRAAMASYPVYG
jgi:hypothetical protein